MGALLPFKLPHYCLYPQCNTLIDNGSYCNIHKSVKTDNQPSRSTADYDRTWQRLRVMKLRQDPLCEICSVKDPPAITPATEVHHIKKVKDCPELRLVMSNLESSCKPCHSKATREENK